jgi:predicted metal-dependent phosphotriesterase family hydrolase
MENSSQNNTNFKTAFVRAVTLQSAVNEKIKKSLDAKARSQTQTNSILSD